jgi:hypothetical protein
MFAIMCEHDLSQIELCGGLVKDLVYNYENGVHFFLWQLIFDFVTIDYIVELDISNLLNYYNDHMRLVALDTYIQIRPLANSFHYYFFIHFNFKNNNNKILNHLQS